MPILLERDKQLLLPKMHRVKQYFNKEKLLDVKETIIQQIHRADIQGQIKPKKKVAIAVGSRGIRNLFLIIQTLVQELLRMGAEPFIVSAMGSHGGGTEEGQRQILYAYGISEERLGIPIITAVETELLGHLSGGTKIYFDSAALHADIIVVVNRIKLHTDFVGPLQSGLCKMMVIGLGNHQGCATVHEANPESFSQILLQGAELILKKAPIGFGIAILENAYDETLQIEAIPASHIIKREKELLQVAKSNMPYIGVREADVLVCQQIGKDISGAGFDPNILGRSSVLKKFVLPVPKIQRMVLLEVTPASHGNAIGLGLFDVVTKRAVADLNFQAIYANGIACKCIEDVKVPLVAEDELEAIRVALKSCRNVDILHPKIIKIKNTLDLEYIWVSEAMLSQVYENSAMTLEDEKTNS